MIKRGPGNTQEAARAPLNQSAGPEALARRSAAADADAPQPKVWPTITLD